MPLKHIVCPVDGSEHALRAVAHAAHLAAALKSRLTLLSVRPYVIGRNQVVEMVTPGEAAEILAAAANLARSHGVETAATVDFQARDVAFAIVDYAEREKADLIVMGSAGKDAVRRFLLGSTSMDVLRKSVCPVTIVH
jgi:nucleotide-binding universal stress UspA family protein